MKNLFLFIMLAIAVFISFLAAKDCICTNCIKERESVRYMTTVEELNGVMYRQINCPNCK